MNGKAVISQKNQNLAAYYFHQGTNFFSYDYLGCHKIGSDRYAFRVWAPNAHSIDLCGDFSSWEGMQMHRLPDTGIWEIEISPGHSIEGARYKFRINSGTGSHMKADPYALSSETENNTASVVHTDRFFDWRDARFLAHRKKAFSGEDFCAFPINIYEMHLGSWRKHADGRYLNYKEIADELVPYLRQMSYTHVEIMPVAEHPFDGSWGYQVCGYYAPTARYGSPEDFKYFINKLHENGIGVIMDWVPAHFPKDEHGLAEFDGSRLYEYQGDDRRENRGWGTLSFDVGREEVQCFLVSNALFWLREYHIDGLRVDAVASMLYLDYDREPGSWIPNEYGDNKNLEAIAFFQKLNSVIFSEFSDVLMIAEESTSWPMITKPVHEGGLGFNFKWNMGWANDVYEYIGTDPYFRKHHHNKLNFSLTYAFSENYILPVSHDEVVHGKLSLLDKMYGSYNEKFDGMRGFLAFMMTHPGKKMLFMGSEYAPFHEWDYQNELEWFMLNYEKHAAMQKYVAEINRFYLNDSRLWEIDFSWNGFEWIYPDMADLNIVAFRRYNKRGEYLDVIVNFAPVMREGFEVTSNDTAEMRIVFNTDSRRFGGEARGSRVGDIVPVKDGKYRIDLPPLGAIFADPLPAFCFDKTNSKKR